MTKYDIIPDMIERVARALADAEERWFSSDTGNLSLMEYKAHAAIEAMREPTIAMIEAEPEGDGEFDKTNSAWHAKAFWQAMIDEALRDQG